MAPAKKAAAKKTAKKATAKKATKRTAKKATAKKATKRTAKKATRRSPAKKAASTNVVVASKVKEAVKGGGVRMSSEFVDALNAEVSATIDKAVARAKSNNRATVRAGDL